MAWQQSEYPLNFEFSESGKSTIGSFSINEQCFIRKQHKCGKMYGASKSCFIACPTDDNLEPILELMSEKLSKVGIEPIIAVKERAYGQDIFCTKICGKIIESRFCIVILDDSINRGMHIPNPNVYYEYGLMTALRKHIIPLQKEDLELAFNIQSYDTIKYNPKNVATELDRAIRDAIKLTEATEPENNNDMISDKIILRRMELAGFEEKDRRWFMSDVIDDTKFKGFGNHEKGFYAYVGKIDYDEDFQTYIDDLSIVVYRTEKKEKELKEKIEELKERQMILLSRYKGIARERFSSIDQTESEIGNLVERLELMATIYIAFIVRSGLDIHEFMKAVDKILETQRRYKTVYNQESKILFDDVIVDLAIDQH